MIKVLSIIFVAVQTISFAQEDSIITYYDNGNLESIIHYKDEVREGNAQFFGENGNKKEELTYFNGKVTGLVRRYDESGTLREMFTIENGKREGPTSLFDSAGTYIEDVYYEEGILLVDKIILDEGGSRNQLTSGEQEQKGKMNTKIDRNNPLPPDVEEEHNYEDDPAFYSSVEVMPEPIGGMQAIYKKISYPKEAKENDIEGIVKLVAFIDRDGEVLDVEVLEGIGYGCDESARLAVFYHRFKPGIQRGQRVKVQLEIPVEFKLDEED